MNLFRIRGTNDTAIKDNSEAERNFLIKKKMKHLKSYYNQRIQLELQLETLTRDSKYSNELAELMHKEEHISFENDFTSHQSKELTKKIDEMMSKETSDFFNRSSKQNMNRWDHLTTKLEKDRMNNNPNSINENETSIRNSTIQIQPIVSITKIDLDLESKLLEQDYNQNWYEYEKFHLNEAFKNQSIKIELDWERHENVLKNEYRKAINKISGIVSQDNMLNHHKQHQPDERFQHPERQKTLIHTSPVLAPLVKNNRREHNNKHEHSSGQDIDSFEVSFNFKINIFVIIFMICLHLIVGKN